MKKVVAFLLALIIFVAPVTTLVKADVVIGDNDDIIINENATILGRKLAMLDSLSDLALSGVTEFSISNTTDVDSYLDSLWSELNDAIESLSDGTGFSQISNDLKSKYFTNLVQYKDYINNRGDYFANLLQNPSTSLLSTYFANNIFGKHSTLQSNLSLDMFRALSDSRRNHPTPDVDYSAICSNISGYILQFTYNNQTYYVDYSSDVYYYQISSGYGPYKIAPQFPFSICINLDKQLICTDIGTVNLTSDGNGGYNALYTFPNKVCFYNHNNVQMNYANTVNYRIGSADSNHFIQQVILQTLNYQNFSIGDIAQNHFDGLSIAMNYLNDHFRHITLYVDGVLWADASDSSTLPTLDIDGYLKIYGNNNPIQYELQPGTQIDYDQLYQVIYNAIRNNLPISQGDINYYDSHDTIYSPTIINNYGEEEGNESDLIDTILDYSVIPKFDTAIAQPMRAALTNGVVIMNTSVTDVIPNDILLILGACFFLLLFAVVINRMIK